MANQWAAGNYMNSGLSKSQYLAKQSKPKATSSSSGTSGIGPVASGDAYAKMLTNNIGPVASGDAYATMVNNADRAAGRPKQNNTSSSSSKPKSVTPKVSSISTSSNNNALGGNSFAGASQIANAKSGYGSGAPISVGNGAFSGGGQQNTLNYIKSLMGNNAQAATDPLAIALAKGSTPDMPTGYGPNGEIYYNNFNPATDGATHTPSYWDANNFSQPGSESAWLTSGTSPIVTANNAANNQTNFGFSNTPGGSGSGNISSGGGNHNNHNNQSPKPVTQPNPTSAISSIISAIINHGQNQQPDYTPTQSNQGTVQRPVGMGQFSSGQYANGAGGYGFGGGGSMLGNNGVTDQNTNWLDMMNPLYTPNAQASEVPQTNQTDMPQNVSGGQGTGNFMNSYLQSLGINPAVVSSYMAGANSTGNGIKTGGNTGNANTTMGGQLQGTQTFDNSLYKQAKKAKKQALDELIKSIKGQYATSTTEGTTALDAAKQQDLLKLSGLFNFGANQDPNSEQRIQYEGRTNADYAGQLKDLLTKLAEGQSKDISGAKQGYQSSLADILQQQSKAQSDYQNQMWDRNYKMLALNQKGGTKSNGTSIEAIMKSQGVDAATARKIYDKQNHLGGGNPIATGNYQTDPDTGEYKQVFLVDGEPGFLY